jgi:hypothetical protein
VTRLFLPLKESVLCWREAEVVRPVVLLRLGGMIAVSVLLMSDVLTLGVCVGGLELLMRLTMWIG